MSLFFVLIVCATSFAQEKSDSQTVRCAVIGGMAETGLWKEISAAFEKRSGRRAEVVAQGNKRVIGPQFERGEIDLLTMHASDTVINLVADGFGENPQPWARNDLVLVGPPDDPAGIKGEAEATKALEQIVQKKCKLLLHASAGANEVLSDVLAAGEIELDLDHVISLPADKHRQMLEKASAEKAYTLVGRIPFLNSKIARHGMQIIVQGDNRLRRPYVVITRVGAKDDARLRAARALAEFLRSEEIQTLLRDFGRGTYDNEPLFFPVTVPGRP